MTSSKMLGILRNHSDTDIEDLGGYLDLLMYLYGYEICMHGHIKYYYKNISVLNINKRITELKLYLSKQALYTSENDIKKELKLTSEEFDFYIGFLSGLEIKEDKETYYRVSIKDLFSVQCCVYRILYENECPMHFQELEHALIVKNRDMTESTLHGSLSKSNPLFAPIGHTGYWVLKEWGMNTDSIRKLVETALTTVNKPLGIDELFKTLNKIRVIDVNSIRSTLCAYNEVFVQYADSTFGLVIWELNKTLKLKKPKTYVKEHLRDILLEKILVLLKNKKPTSLSKLIESLKKSGYSKPTIYAAITAREDLFNKTELKGPKGRLISLR
jgi:biotin operon repressor